MVVGKIKSALNANFPFVVGGLFSLSSFACPCPFCYAAAGTSFIGGIAQKLGIVK